MTDLGARPHDLDLLDTPTGALSRAALEARIAADRHALRAAGEGAAFILGDVDHLGAIATAYGDRRADDVLRGIVARLLERRGGWIYRVGGDEFAVLLPGADERAGTTRAEMLRASVAIRPVAGLPVTMSFGVAATARGAGLDDATLPSRAAAALLGAKTLGRNRVGGELLGIVTPEIEQRARRIVAPQRRTTAIAPWWSAITSRLHPPKQHEALALPAVATVPDRLTVDMVTQALTPQALQWRAAELAYRTEHTGEPVAVVVADIDGLHDVNERWGRRASNDVLREVVGRIAEQTPGPMCPYRRGDEFVVLLDGDDARHALAVAERVRAAVAAASGGVLRLGASVGVSASAPAMRFDLGGVLARARHAARVAHTDGGDQVRIHGVRAPLKHARPAPVAPAVPAPEPAALRALRAA